MITSRTRLQLVVFVLITMVGCAYVGARYARLDRLFFDDSYVVAAHFAESGGIFAGAEVSYRGVTVGQVGELVLTDSGVDVLLDIDDGHGHPAATPAPSSPTGRRSGSSTSTCSRPPTTGRSWPRARRSPPTAPRPRSRARKLLVDLDRTVKSVHRRSLTTVVDELGPAFKGTGDDLGQIIDTSNSFIRTANRNFDLTTALLRGRQHGAVHPARQELGDPELRPRPRAFSDDPGGQRRDLRRVIANGSATADQLRTFLEQNGVDLGELINHLVTTGEVTGRHIAGTEMILVVYPYVVAGGYTVVDKDETTGLFDAHFGLDAPAEPPGVPPGYDTRRRDPEDRAEVR